MTLAHPPLAVARPVLRSLLPEYALPARGPQSPAGNRATPA